MKKFYKLFAKKEGEITEGEKQDAYDQAMNALEGALISQSKETNRAKKEIGQLSEAFAKNPEDDTLRRLISRRRDLVAFAAQKAEIEAIRDELNADEK